MTRVRVLTVWLGLVLLASTLGGQAITPIWTMDCGAAGVNYPLCGADVVAESGGHSGVVWAKSYQATGGPNSIPAIQYAFIPQASNSQTNIGLTKGHTAPTQGTDFVIRWYLKINAGFNVPTTHWGNKFFIDGDGVGQDGNRLMSIGAPVIDVTDISLKLGKNINGPPDATGGINMPIGTWHAFQAFVHTSSTAVATNGTLKFYMDNDVFATPNASALSMSEALPTATWQALHFGGFADMIVTGETLTLLFACVEMDDAFDVAWYNGGTPPARCGSGAGGGSSGVIGGIRTIISIKRPE